MTLPTTHAFDLPARLAAKSDPALLGADERHLAALAATLDHQLADVSRRLDEARRAPTRHGQEALDRDQEVHRLTARLHTLRRFGLDLCLGRTVPADGSDPVYVGRLGLTDPDGRRLLVDWRSPAAEPFFAATRAHPMGLASRRRYRWTGGRVTDYWDEVFTPDGRAAGAAPDDESAFVASLGASRSARMRDVLATIAADQDAIVRAPSPGTLVVDGGPGTGKTVVALHRTAYLLYTDPRLAHRRGGVLFVGPHQPYLDYVADVLPSLGEEGVRTCTLRDLVPEGRTARPEPDPRVAALKADARLVAAVDAAVAFYERPPTVGLDVETPWADVRVTPQHWAEAFDAVEPGTPHHEAREQVRDALVEIVVDAVRDALSDGGSREGAPRDEDAPSDAPDDATGPDDATLRRHVAGHLDLTRALAKAWPTLEAGDVVGDLWDVPAYLRLCAPWLTPDEVRALQRDDPQAWTVADLPLLDAARRRLGDPDVSARRRRREASEAAQRARMTDVVDDLIRADDSTLAVMHMLRGDDLRDALVDTGAVPEPDADPLAGPFAHVVVDEAQELTDAEWQMVLARCPSRSLTVVGDRAQARRGFAEGWVERLERVGLGEVRLASLTVNYRTPTEVMVAAEPVIRAVLPDANVPTSVRSTGIPVAYGQVAGLDALLTAWLAAHDEGVACVVRAPGAQTGAPAGEAARVPAESDDRVHSLTPALAKGLEFDLVVLVDPDGWGDDQPMAAVDRYVAMTRATQRLVILTP